MVHLRIHHQGYKATGAYATYPYYFQRNIYDPVLAEKKAPVVLQGVHIKVQKILHHLFLFHQVNGVIDEWMLILNFKAA